MGHHVFFCFLTKLLSWMSIQVAASNRNRVVGSQGVSPTTSVILLGTSPLKKGVNVFGVRPFFAVSQRW